MGRVGGHQKRRNILERGGGICKVMEVRNIRELSKKKGMWWQLQEVLCLGEYKTKQTHKVKEQEIRLHD